MMDEIDKERVESRKEASEAKLLVISINSEYHSIQTHYDSLDKLFQTWC